MGPKPCIPPISCTPFIARLPVGHLFQSIATVLGRWACPVAEAGDSRESVADPLPQRGRSIRRPCVEAASRLEPELAAGDLLAKTRRWFGGAVDGGKELLGDRQGQIPARGLEDL